MKLGVFIGPIFPGDMSGPDAFDLALRLARAARESGFDGIFAAQHYVLGPSHQMMHPLVLLARLAAEFPGGYLGTSVYLLPFTHPVEAAESTALLDVISGGKLILGVGKGYRAAEFASFDIPRAERGARLAEAVRAVREALDRRAGELLRRLLLLRRRDDPAQAGAASGATDLGRFGHRAGCGRRGGLRRRVDRQRAAHPHLRAGGAARLPGPPDRSSAGRTPACRCSARCTSPPPRRWPRRR